MSVTRGQIKDVVAKLKTVVLMRHARERCFPAFLVLMLAHGTDPVILRSKRKPFRGNYTNGLWLLGFVDETAWRRKIQLQNIKGHLRVHASERELIIIL